MNGCLACCGKLSAQADCICEPLGVAPNGSWAVDKEHPVVTVNFGGSSTKAKYLKFGGVGLVVVAAAFCLKFFVFNQQQYLVPVHTIAMGESLDSQEFRVANLSLGPLGSKYLHGRTKPHGYASQPIFAGNLVARAAISATAPADFVRLVVTSKTALGTAIHAGSIVAIWSAARLTGNEYDVPKRLAGAVSVARVVKQQGVFASKPQEVEVLINPLQAPAVISAMATDSPIFLVAQE
jgi:hypothetical protein